MTLTRIDLKLTARQTVYTAGFVRYAASGDFSGFSVTGTIINSLKMSTGEGSLKTFFFAVMFFRVYFHAYIHLRFKHTFLGTHLKYMGCLSRTVI